MTVQDEREVRAPPAMVLAALGTAGENLGWKVRDVRAREGLLLMSTGLSLRGASLGFIVTARARRFNQVTKLTLDATPLVGSWALKSADATVQALIREFQLVMSAPQARIRRPERASPGGAPFGALPQVLGVVWALLTGVLFGLAGGGWFWVPALAGILGGGLLLVPRTSAWWSRSLTVLALVSLPFGLIGAIARRMARANALWQGSLLT